VTDKAVPPSVIVGLVAQAVGAAVEQRPLPAMLIAVGVPAVEYDV
jgi:hypothetical protein